MKSSKLIRHILFWLTFFCISLYNELYLSRTFIASPSITLVVQCAIALCFIYLVKIAVVYSYLYLLIPRWMLAPRKLKYYVWAILLLFLGAFAIRIITQEVIWVYMYKEGRPDLSPTELVARYFYSLLDLLQISAISIAIMLFKLRINAVRREKRLVQEKLNAEILHLKAQTNPHFLFNTLNSIFSLSRANAPQTPDAIMKLSRILRYMLYEAKLATKPIEDELNIIRDFIALQEMRFGDRIKMKLHTDIDNLGTPIAPLLLLPLLENAYKHSNQAQAVIVCSIALQSNHLAVTVSNPIAQISLPDKEEQGIGLGNIKRQLELLYHKFNLTINHTKQQFTVSLEIDLHTYAENELFDNRG